MVDPARVRRFLIAAIAALAVAGLAAQYAIWELDRYGYGLVELFDPVGEGNLPAFASALLLGLCAVLLAWAAPTTPHPRRVRALAAGFAVLMVDEACALHEKVGTALGELVGGGVYAWIAPGALIAIALAFLFVRLVADAPMALRRPLVTGTAVFVASALVIEGVEAALDRGLAWGVVATIQEAGELAGISIVFVGLLAWVARSGCSLELRTPAQA